MSSQTRNRKLIRNVLPINVLPINALPLALGLFVTLLFVFVALQSSRLGQASGPDVFAPPTPTPTVILKGLKDAVPDDFTIGVAIEYSKQFPDPLLESTVPQEFNSITFENELKFRWVHPCPPGWLIDQNAAVYQWVANKSRRCSTTNPDAVEWEWKRTDPLINWAKDHDIGVYGHVLVYHFDPSLPPWIVINKQALSALEIRRIMKGHIEGVLEHLCAFPNVYAMDVVNEAFTDTGLTNTFWNVTIPNEPNYDYIVYAFLVAEKTLRDPSCNRGNGSPNEIKLFYNDNFFEYGGPEADAIFDYFEPLTITQQSIVDGIGFQTHVNPTNTAYPPVWDHDTGKLIANMNRFGSLGLEVKVTELDVRIFPNGKRDYYWDQAEVYRGVVGACLVARSCTGVTMWGVHDGNSWADNESTGYYPHPLLFWDEGQQVYSPTIQTCVSPTLSLSSQSLDDEGSAILAGSLSPLPGWNSRNRILIAETPEFQHCPKPAYGMVYDVFLSYQVIHLPIVANMQAVSSSRRPYSCSPTPIPP